MGKIVSVLTLALLGLAGSGRGLATDAAVANDAKKPDAEKVHPVHAVAKSAVAKSVTQLGEVIVAAQRRDEKLNDVPIAVSAYTSKDRDALGILSIDDIARMTPSMSYQDYPNRLSIRGVGRFTNAIGTDPGVAIYNDGVYSPETGSISQSPLFVDRIEVLNGPQGTLYGQNSIGGAVNVISKRPTGTTQAEARLDMGNYRTINPSAAI